MASTERQSPLAAWSERFARASTTPVAFAIRELPLTTQVNLRGNGADPAFAAAVRSAIGCDAPVAANTYTRQGERAALWLGPDEWLVVDRPDRGDDITG